MDELDITRTIISSDFIYNHINTLFPDSVLLNKHFTILGLSVSIQCSLGYSNEEICGKPISFLTNDKQWETILEKRLQSGFFTEEEIVLTKKNGNLLNYSVSGFYLGLLSDISGVILLRFINKDGIRELDAQLQQVKSQLDTFVYRTAHDLRGPLATIQGLVNLIQIRKDDREIDHLVQLISTHAKKLDERLYQLLYITDVDKIVEEPTYSFYFEQLETHLRQVIEKNSFVNFLELHMKAPVELISGYNELLINGVLTNLILHLVSLPKNNNNCYIKLLAKSHPRALHIKIKVKGFIADPDVQENFDETGSSIYTNMMRYSKLAHFFAAQKLALKLKAIINIHFIEADYQQISLTIPKMR